METELILVIALCFTAVCGVASMVLNTLTMRSMVKENTRLSMTEKAIQASAKIHPMAGPSILHKVAELDKSDTPPVPEALKLRDTKGARISVGK
jgi:hypothetical protein